MMRHYSLVVNFCSNTTQHWLIIFTPTGHTHRIPDAGLSSVTIHQSNLCMKTLETSAWIKTLEENTHDCTKPAELPPPPPPLGYTTTSFDKTSDLCPRFSLCLKDGGRLGRVTMYTERERENRLSRHIRYRLWTWRRRGFIITTNTDRDTERRGVGV